MWTDSSRGRIAKIAKKSRRSPAKKGRRRKIELREVLNAIRYLARTGCGWQMLPKDFPPPGTVYWWFRRFVRQMLFRTILDVALMLDRERAGREASPSAATVDSRAEWRRHASWGAFLAARGGARFVLLTTRAAKRYECFAFAPGDTLLVGRESAGVPEEVHAAADARLRIPMREGARSLNVALAAAMAVGEALRQLGTLPADAAGTA